MADPSIERFRRVVGTAYAQLEERRGELNDLNVFPVADGDTGDNMALTMRAVLEELDRLDGQAIDEMGRTEIVQAVARAALMGARGNSGVILSQIVRGATEELASRPGQLVDPQLVSAAISKAVTAAYESVQEPAEGTMLTALREMANAISHRLAHMEHTRLSPEAPAAEQDALLAEILEAAIEAGEAAVERSPQQLEALADAGVVDSGAYGLVVILAGMVAGLRGDGDGLSGVAHHRPPARPVIHHEDSRFRWCVNFVVTGEELDARPFFPRLEAIGDSVLVVGDPGALRVHVHTDDPAAARAIFSGVGGVEQVEDADMREQIEARHERLTAHARCGAVAVAAGRGMRAMFEELGAHVVEGGATLNPSPDELLAAIEKLATDEAVILPNSPNVVLAAEQAAELSGREVAVVPSTSQQAGLAALVELNTDAPAAENAEHIGEALAEVRTGAVAPAARDDAQGRFVRGDAVGFVGDEVVAWGGAGTTLAAVVERLGDGAEILTVIEGQGAPIPLEQVAAVVPEGVELELHEGGQPSWWWLLAAQ